MGHVNESVQLIVNPRIYFLLAAECESEIRGKAQWTDLKIYTLWTSSIHH